MLLRMRVLSLNILDLRIHQGRLNGHEQRSQCCKPEQRAWSDTSVHRLTPTYHATGVPKPEVSFRTFEPPHRRRSAWNRAYVSSGTNNPDSALGRNSRLGGIASRRNLGRMSGLRVFIKLCTLLCTTTSPSSADERADQPIGTPNSPHQGSDSGSSHDAPHLVGEFRHQRSASPAHIRRSRSARRCPSPAPNRSHGRGRGPTMRRRRIRR
jgi:hypothetical protein